MNASKLLNFFKVLASYYLSRMMNKPFMFGYPVSAAIEPTTSCNLRCPHCISGTRGFTRPTGMMEPGDYSGIIAQIGKRLLNLTLYFQGEPFLNPAFYDMISLASKNKIYTMTSTNGHYLTKENAGKVVKSGLSRIIISVDSFDQDTYSRYRIGGNINIVRNGIENMIRARSEHKATWPLIILQFLIYRENENQISLLRKTARRMGADKVEFKTMQIYDFEKGSPFIPEKKKHSRYIKDRDGNYGIKGRYYNHCWKMWHSCVITWDSKVVPCCFDKDALHSPGTIKGDGDFDRIWNGEEYRIFRSKVFNHRKSIDICSNCTEGTSIWI